MFNQNQRYRWRFINGDFSKEDWKNLSLFGKPIISRDIIDYDSYFYGPTISVTIRQYQVLEIYRKVTESCKRTKCTCTGLWLTRILNTILFIFPPVKKVMLRKRKYSGKTNEQSKAENSLHTSCDVGGWPYVFSSHGKVLVAG